MYVVPFTRSNENVKVLRQANMGIMHYAASVAPVQPAHLPSLVIKCILRRIPIVACFFYSGKLATQTRLHKSAQAWLELRYLHMPQDQSLHDADVTVVILLCEKNCVLIECQMFRCQRNS